MLTEALALRPWWCITQIEVLLESVVSLVPDTCKVKPVHQVTSTLDVQAHADNLRVEHQLRETEFKNVKIIHAFPFKPPQVPYERVD